MHLNQLCSILDSVGVLRSNGVSPHKNKNEKEQNYMLVKVRVQSKRYEGENIAILFQPEKNIFEIGGKMKLFFECRGLILKKFLPEKISQKNYKKGFVRYIVETDIDTFYSWIDMLQNHDYSLQFVDSLGRIMR